MVEELQTQNTQKEKADNTRRETSKKGSNSHLRTIGGSLSSCACKADATLSRRGKDLCESSSKVTQELLKKGKCAKHSTSEVTASRVFSPLSKAGDVEQQRERISRVKRMPMVKDQNLCHGYGSEGETKIKTMDRH